MPLSLGRMAPSFTKAARNASQVPGGYIPGLRQARSLLSDGRHQGSGKERFMHADRKKIEEDFFQFGRVDGSAIGRETDEKTCSDAFFRYFTGGTCKNLLTAVAY